MQTILGSSGQIGQELAKELHKNFTQDIRLVSRNPQKVNESDETFPANLMNLNEAIAATKDSEIVYFTVGLPMDSKLMEEQFPIIVKNVIQACQQNNCKLVFLDNTYMYAKNNTPQLEDTSFNPTGRKSVLRARVANMVIKAMQQGNLKALIGRAPEFYGPTKTKSITNTMIFNKIRSGKRANVPVSDKTVRTLIWTPDASRALALLGNTEDAYGQTWHLPSAESITYQSMIEIAEKIMGKSLKYNVIKMWEFNTGALFSKRLRELKELLPRYEYDNVFLSDKFKSRFPDFEITSVEAGIRKIIR